MKLGCVCNFVLSTALFFSICLTGVVDAQEAVAQLSGYSLIGTIEGSDVTGAVIAVSKDEQSFFRKFEKLPDGSKIVDVQPDHILLKRDDGTFYNMFISHNTKVVASISPRTQSITPPEPTAISNASAERLAPDRPAARKYRRIRHASDDE